MALMALFFTQEEEWMKIHIDGWVCLNVNWKAGMEASVKKQ